MLAVSGKLNRQAGGPGFRPFTIGAFNSAFYQIFDADKPELNRRSIYRIQVNSAKDPLLDVLDCPEPLVKTPRRSTTTTPLQALAMMNHSFVQRQSAAFADRVIKEAGASEKSQIALAYRLAFGRVPVPQGDRPGTGGGERTWVESRVLGVVEFERVRLYPVVGEFVGQDGQFVA